MPISEAYNQDCLEYMKSLPDNYFDLCVADPPYGDGLHAEDGGGKGWFTKYNQRSQSVNVERERERAAKRSRHGQGRNCRQPDGTWGYAKWRQVEPVWTAVRPLQAPDGADGTWLDDRPDMLLHTHTHTHTSGAGSNQDGRDLGGEVRKKIIAWDVAPEKEYFTQIFRVSRNQIIWGGNYFDLPPTRCFLVWRKLSISETFSMAMAEYAWTSFSANAKVFEAAPQGRPGDEHFHPTQKPIDLYRWIYGLFTEPGQKIFDPYLGSGSSRIAAWDAGLDFVGCEIDPIYFAKEEERFSRYTSQMNLFLQEDLFQEDTE